MNPTTVQPQSRSSMEPFIVQDERSNPPEYSENFIDSADRKEKISSPKAYNDIWATILWVVHLLIFFGVAIYFLYKGEFSFLTGKGGVYLSKSSLFVILGSCGVSFIFSVIFVTLIKLIPVWIIHGSFFFSFLLLAASAVASGIKGSIGAAIITGILALLSLLFWFMIRSKIALSAQLLTVVSKFSSRFPSTLYVGLAFLLIQLAYVLFWILSILSLIDNKWKCNDFSKEKLTDCLSSMPPERWGALIYMVFSMFWTTQLLKDVLHITISGTFATDYFFPSVEPGQSPSKLTTFSSLKRAMTTSFGSACFGSLLLAVIRTMRFIASLASEDSEGWVKFVACCIDCILSCIEGMIDFINTYAYTYCAIYGQSFVEAGKSTFALLNERGVMTIINDSIVSSVVGMGAMLAGLLGAGYAYVYIIIAKPEHIYNDNSMTITFAVLCFIVAISIYSVFSQVIESASAAFFVCLAEEPQCLKTYDFETYTMIKDSYPEVISFV